MKSPTAPGNVWREGMKRSSAGGCRGSCTAGRVGQALQDGVERLRRGGRRLAQALDQQVDGR
jgi:hypothetical protein